MVKYEMIIKKLRDRLVYDSKDQKQTERFDCAVWREIQLLNRGLQCLRQLTTLKVEPLPSRSRSWVSQQFQKMDDSRSTQAPLLVTSLLFACFPQASTSLRGTHLRKTQPPTRPHFPFGTNYYVCYLLSPEPGRLSPASLCHRARARTCSVYC